jgi:hypothetical protein
MKSMWEPEALPAMRERIERLTPERAGAWGKMTAPQMVCHLADSLKMALGELPVVSKKVPIRFAPLKQLIVYWAPFPKNAPTAPELTVRAPAEWSADLADLQGLVDRLCTRGADPNAAWPEHPAFGRLSHRAWGVLVYRHMDHHLRQFGA